MLLPQLLSAIGAKASIWSGPLSDGGILFHRKPKGHVVEQNATESLPHKFAQPCKAEQACGGVRLDNGQGVTGLSRATRLSAWIWTQPWC